MTKDLVYIIGLEIPDRFIKAITMSTKKKRETLQKFYSKKFFNVAYYDLILIILPLKSEKYLTVQF